eukprot:1156785-Pelagomonas_calceolata.AAC.12
MMQMISPKRQQAQGLGTSNQFPSRLICHYYLNTAHAASKNAHRASALTEQSWLSGSCKGSKKVKVDAGLQPACIEERPYIQR